jgi:hypothetical protein
MRFNRKNPNIHFREFTQLKKICTLDPYIKKIRRMAVRVTNISEQRLVMLFIEGLAEPLRGWVEAFRPATL